MSGAVGTTGSDVRPDARPVFIRHAASALGLVCPESSVLVAPSMKAISCRCFSTTPRRANAARFWRSTSDQSPPRDGARR